jgi:hypothetical protein
MLKGSEGDCLPASALILPGREERDEDKRAQKLLPTKSAAPYVNPDDYFPVIAQGRADETTRKAYPVTINGKRVRQRPLPIRRSAQGTMGRVADDPLSFAGFTTSTTILERSDLGWRTRSETTTNVWSETDGKGAICSSRPNQDFHRP